MNLFSISSLILSFSGIFFSLIIFRSDKKSRINRSWFFSSISFSLWALSLAGVTLSSTIEVALWWQYLLDVSAIFLPYLYLIFILNFLELKKKAIRYIFLILACSLSVFSFTPLFKVGMIKIYEFYWVSPGEYYIVFPTYFMSFAMITLGLLIQQYFRAPKKSIMRAQVRNTLIAGTFAYLGGVTNFFPQLFSIYPFGNYLVIFYIVFMVYGVLRYGLLSVKVISAQVFSTALVLVSLFNLLKSVSLSDWSLNFIIFILVIIFSIFLIQSVNREIKAREKIEKLATDLEKANVRLRELDKQKSEFVSFATHQLRAPLTAMKGYASLILEGDLGPLTKEVGSAIGRIYDSSKTLASIVDDYLNISRIELGTMVYSFDVLDLKGMVEEVIAELQPNIVKSGLKFTFAAGNASSPSAGTGSPAGTPTERYMVHADKDKLKQVIVNLIDNSMKYTPKGSIAVSVTRNTADRKIVFCVKDTGVGITPEAMPKLFAKFVRADNANKQNIYGTGLGLFVAKEIVTAHKGRVWAESDGDGKGAAFFMELDMAV